MAGFLLGFAAMWSQGIEVSAVVEEGMWFAKGLVKL
jgi:hypothetical protein